MLHDAVESGADDDNLETLEDLGSAPGVVAEVEVEGTGVDLGSTGLSAADLGTTDLGSIDLGAIDLCSNDMGATDLGSTELGSTDLGVVNFGATGPGASDLHRGGLGATGLSTADLAGVDLETGEVRSSEPTPLEPDESAEPSEVAKAPVELGTLALSDEVARRCNDVRVSTAATDGELNQAQQQVMDVLGTGPEGRPRFAPDLADELLAELSHALAPAAARHRGDRALWVSKFPLAQVLGCEGKWMAERDLPFAYDVATARGQVSHKAIELGVFWRDEEPPLTLVHEAMNRLGRQDNSLAEFLITMNDGDRSELVAAANEKVAKFFECFPPLNPRWRPVPEASMRAELCDGRIVLAGKTDLTLGFARGREAGKVIIDLKTGSVSPQHPDDLRFYALVELLRLGVPPRRLATYYLDTGHLHVEDVTEDLLRSATRRVIDGVTRMVELVEDGEEARLVAGPPCRWCPVLDLCDVGKKSVSEFDEFA